MDSVALFAAGFLAWTISSLSAGGGSVLFVATVSQILGSKSVAPIATLSSLIGSLSRLVLFWRHIDWQLVRWYVPGAAIGAVAGGWAFTRISATLLQIVVAVFLISTVWQFRFGNTARSFTMRLHWFVPVSVVSGFTSGLTGASGLLVNPFYLNYGLIREPMLATRAVNSLVIQIAKLGAYSLFGALTPTSIENGLIAGTGALVSIWLSRIWLPLLSTLWFRKFTVSVMLGSGIYLLWQQRGAFLVLLALP